MVVALARVDRTGAYERGRVGIVGVLMGIWTIGVVGLLAAACYFTMWPSDFTDLVAWLSRLIH